jgi:DNA-binding transcriptional regulator YiaG
MKKQTAADKVELERARDLRELQELFDASGMFQRELAAHPEVTADIRTVQRWLSGDIRPRRRTARLLRRVLIEEANSRKRKA